MFSAAKASERARALRPTTGTGNERRRTLTKSKFICMVPVAADFNSAGYILT